MHGNGESVMIDENHRRDIARWVGVLLWIIGLESHVVGRPIVFLLGPFVLLILTYVARVRVRKWQRTWLTTALLCLAGFLLTKFVFKGP